MRTLYFAHLPHRLFVIASLLGTALLALGTQAQVAASKPTATAGSAEAVAACERAARQSLAPQPVLVSASAPPPPELRFTGTPAVQAGLSNENQVVLQGGVSARNASGMRTYTYSCNVDLRSPESVGLVLRDTTPVGAENRAPRVALEPDLNNLSPAVCESSAAAALKSRWPRVSQISFDGNTRRVVQQSASQAELRGQGRAQPAPGAPYAHFGFQCEIDSRNGRVLSTRISG
jgi:hypothetical protein